MPGESGDSLAGEAGEGVSSLRTLSSLPWDEKTENGMLRSRLDEQSQLICMLKRRADDTLLRCRGLETANEELGRKSAEAESCLIAERRRGARLEDSFHTLAANHQEMIRFKDEYKRQNEELRAECQRLREDRYPELLEKERSIQELRAQVQAASTELGALRETQQEESHTLRERLGQLLEENRAGSREQQRLSRTLKDSEETCHQVKEELSHLEEVRRIEQNAAEKKVDELNKEKQELLQLCMERGRILQERQREATELSSRFQNAEKACREAEERYQRDVTAVDADARIVELNRRLGDSEKELGQMRREFDAYKKHSGELLAKERELNAKLRHLIG